MKNRRIRISFEYTNPNTHPIISAFAAVFGIVFVISLIILSIIWM